MRRQYRMEVLSVLVNTRHVLATAILQDGLRRSKRSVAAALVTHFVGIADANRLDALYDL